MQMAGELIGNKIVVKKPKDVGRLYNKSHFGKPLSDNQLELNLLEGVFLLGDEKIKVFSKKNEVNFRDLIKLAAEKIPGFESKYLVFRDLRYRGHSVNINDSKDFDLHIAGKDDSKPHYISVFSERYDFDVVGHYARPDVFQLIINEKKGGIKTIVEDQEWYLFSFGGAVELVLELDSEEELNAIWDRVKSMNFTIIMELEKQFWGAIYGRFVDQDGIGW